MKKLILGVLTATAVAAPLAIAGPASAATGTTTQDIAVDVASEAPTALPALNSQFTSNDRPGYYFDNTGSLNVHVVRTKG